MTSNSPKKDIEPICILSEPLSAADLQKSIDALFRTYVSYGKIQGISTGYRLELQVMQLQLLLTFTKRLATQWLAEAQAGETTGQKTTLDLPYEDEDDDVDMDEDLITEF